MSCQMCNVAPDWSKNKLN